MRFSLNGLCIFVSGASSAVLTDCGKMTQRLTGAAHSIKTVARTELAVLWL